MAQSAGHPSSSTRDMKEKATGQFEKLADAATDNFRNIADQAEGVANRMTEQGREVGEKVQEVAGNFKGAVDLVTAADHESEAFLTGELARRFPEHAVLAEESGGGERAAAHRWLVDPLDGTTNFAHGYPFFAVSMAPEMAEPLRRH